MSLDLDIATRAAGGGSTGSGVRRRLRVLATGPTTPDRLRRLGAVLVLGCLLVGAVGLVDVPAPALRVPRRPAAGPASGE